MNAVAVIEQTPTELYRTSTNAADLCKGIVLATAMEIQSRKYVRVEGWQAIAVAHGCTASACNVERIEGGVRAIGEIRRMSDGALIAQAEGFVGEDEPTWFGGEVVSYGKKRFLPRRPDYAIRAMAQTRAISRACRSAFAHVVVMMNAGLQTTPAEEMAPGGFDDEAPVTARPDYVAQVKALKASIDAIADRIEAEQWRADNTEIMARLAADAPDLHDEVAVYWKAHAKKLPARAASPKPNGAQPSTGDFDTSGVRLGDRP